MPLIPILIGVVILGLAFGAGLSVLTQRESNAPIAVVTAAPTPGLTPPPQASPAPAATSTPRKRIAKTQSTSSAAPLASPKRLALASPSAATSSPSARAHGSSAPHAVDAVTPVPSREPAIVATAEPRSPPTDEADSDFARLSAAVVRAYFASLARGDDAAARAALDPSKPRDLGEKEFVDSSLRITSLDAHGTGNSATVNVDMATTRGEYFEQFYLRRSPAGAVVIVDHTYIRP